LKKLYVGNLPWSVDDNKLAELFSKYSSVTSATVLKDRETNRSRGFGFVELSDDEEAKKAIEEISGLDIDGRKLIVNEARPREDKKPGQF